MQHNACNIAHVSNIIQENSNSQKGGLLHWVQKPIIRSIWKLMRSKWGLKEFRTMKNLNLNSIWKFCLVITHIS